MLKRLDAMDSELTDLTESLRVGSGRLKDELDVLESELRDLSGTTQAPELQAVPDEPVEEQPELEVHEELEPKDEGLEVVEEQEPVTMADVVHNLGLINEPVAKDVALNMALNGTPRDETDRYLEENFELSDRGQLLDEVYASVDA